MEVTTDQAKQLVRNAWSEDEFQKHVIELAKGLGWKVAHFRKVRVQRKNGSVYWETPVAADGKGWPDLILVRGPRIVAAELKVKRNVASQEQKDWLLRLGGAGLEVFLWSPESWDSINLTLEV